jgi:hypothetical protein
MERGVLWGGLLISGSFLLAVTLHQAARERPAPPGAAAEHVRIESADRERVCGNAGAAGVRRSGVRRSSDCDREPITRKSPE